MTWLVEQSEDSSSVTVEGNSVRCTKEGYYGSPINVLYQDPAKDNGKYFWEIRVDQSEQDAGSSISVGLTTDDGFKGGWALRAMKYLGNLSDGGALLVSQFGDPIANGDKVGILLELSSSDLKFYLFHNDRPLGLAFHIQSPYTKPLYPVVSFSCNGRVTISRSSSLPSSVARSQTEYNGIEGHWNIVESNLSPDLAHCQIEFHSQDGNPNNYRVHSRVVNSMNASLHYDSSTGQVRVSQMMSTLMMGPPELMRKESCLSEFLSSLVLLTVNGQHLIARNQANQEVRLERYTPPPPGPVTNNIFN